MKRLNTKKGLTLIEIILVLVIAAIVAGSVMALGSDTLGLGKRQATVRSIDGLHQKAIQWVAQEGGSTYAGVTVAVPTKNKWGGTYAVAANGTDPNKLDITLTGVEAEDGTALVAVYTDRSTPVYDSVAKMLTVTF